MTYQVDFRYISMLPKRSAPAGGLSTFYVDAHSFQEAQSKVVFDRTKAGWAIDIVSIAKLDKLGPTVSLDGGTL